MSDAVARVPERLARLDGAVVGSWRLRLAHCRPHRFSGWRYVAFHLVSPAGRSDEPVLWGVFSAGGKRVAAWLECDYRPQLLLGHGTTLDLHASGLHVALFTAVAGILPPDGHVMVAYEGRQHIETFLAIQVRVPLVATQLGAALFDAGFRGGFKDWYFAEGGMEGPLKLQANRAHDGAHARAICAATASELHTYLQREPSTQHPDIERRARERARQLLKRLKDERR